MLLTTTPDSGAILPPNYGALIVQPVFAASIAAQVATIAVTTANSYRIPVVTDDPNASWSFEGSEITPSDASIEEIIVTPAAIKALSIVSNEMADDSAPGVAEIIGAGLARDTARRLDQAFFTSLPAPAPSGLNDLNGIQGVDGASVFADLDAFAECQSVAEEVGASISHFIMDPHTALGLARVKAFAGSATPLLGMDATAPGQRRILGVPVLVSPYVAARTVWAVDSSRIILVVRDDTTVTSDRSVYFSSDRCAIRSVCRMGFAFPHPTSVVKIVMPAPAPVTP